MCAINDAKEKKNLAPFLIFFIYLLVKKSLWCMNQELIALDSYIKHSTHVKCLINYSLSTYVSKIVLIYEIVSLLLAHYSHRINICSYLVTIYRDIFVLNIKDMCRLSVNKFFLSNNNIPWLSPYTKEG